MNTACISSVFTAYLFPLLCDSQSLCSNAALQTVRTADTNEVDKLIFRESDNDRKVRYVDAPMLPATILTCVNDHRLSKLTLNIIIILQLLRSSIIIQEAPEVQL